MYTPEGYGTVFPYMMVERAAEFVVFLENTFGATEIGRTELPDGRLAEGLTAVPCNRREPCYGRRRDPLRTATDPAHCDPPADALPPRSVHCGAAFGTA